MLEYGTYNGETHDKLVQNSTAKQAIIVKLLKILSIRKTPNAPKQRSKSD